jgi:hypothetical protein
MITPNGILLEQESKVVAPNTGTWSDLSGTEWSEWNNYTLDAPEFLIYLLEAQDLGSVQDFCLSITTQANGVVDYYVYTSNTGAFSGEEVEHEILSEADNVPAFTARYFQVGISVEKISAAQEILSTQVQVINSRNKFSIDNVDTADINDGSTQGYLLPLGRSVGTITNVQITPREVTPFQLDVYVTDEPTSTMVVPHVTSKTSDAVSFALYGLDNKPRDAIVDVLIEYLPEMYMDGLALRVR